MSLLEINKENFSKKFLDINNLSVELANFELKNLNLKIEGHSYVVILGKIASGKSVLLKTIAGFFTPKSGEIWLDGKKISELPPHKRGVGYVPQHNDLFPHMTVRENIVFPLKVRGDKNALKSCDELIGLFELRKIADRNVNNLSGGERKKVAIARAIAANPKILLLDEPFGMLDEPARDIIREIIREIHNKLKITIIHVSHDRNDAWELGKFCAIMENGTITQFGKTAEVFRNPNSHIIADFTGCKNIFPARFESKNQNFSIADIGELKLDLSKKIEFSSGFVAIRPEMIKFFDIPEKSAPNLFPAKILSIHDKGEFCEIRAIIQGIEFSTYCSHPEALRLKNSPVLYLQIEPEHIHCIL
ncbi:MAG TPA: ABC transporter ATP-binding protein [Victivallales bacterium]|nr:ABC transporter ATP-binding protein [Victivallales bacterium]HPO89954.1 ABC transporter ATP-binding protein [Victivallales bacterium]HRR05669.1 ABC transporter ATP-binding protein [Victivallales bacterium]HRU01333.1 ABC transporter ATP-binding protein [Victivallales bacterium]